MSVKFHRNTSQTVPEPTGGSWHLLFFAPGTLMPKPQTRTGFAEEVKKRAIMAMFSDDELMDRRGGNLLDIVYEVSVRFP